MKPTQLIIILLLLPLTGFTQSAWDYDSLPKRQPYDLRNSLHRPQHITDWYATKYELEEGKKVKSAKLYWRHPDRDTCFGKQKYEYEYYYDSLGRKERTIKRDCLYEKYDKWEPSECESKIMYEVTDSFYLVTEGFFYCDTKTEDVATIEINYYSKETGYLIKYEKQWGAAFRVILYTYNDKFQLLKARDFRQDQDTALLYQLRYKEKKLVGDTVQYTAYFVNKSHPENEPLDETKVIYKHIHIFVNGELIEMCDCSKTEISMYEKKPEDSLCPKGCRDMFTEDKSKENTKKWFYIEYY